jgi:dTMP kinase
MTGSASKGLFITFEGGEGSGKSTQIRLLAAALRRDGREVVETREPGGSPMGERIRGLLLDPEARLDAVTQALLFSAARRDHVVNLIEPALKRGAMVLCDRFADSTRAYQQAAGAVPAALVETLTAAAIGGTAPDLTFVLDIDPVAGLARASKRRGTGGKADAFEAADLDFHRRVREGYLAIAAREPSRCAVIDASGSAETVADCIGKVISSRLKLHEKSASNG